MEWNGHIRDFKAMKPSVITKRTLIQSIPDRWRRQYLRGRDGREHDWLDRQKECIYNRLRKLDLSVVSAQEIAAIVGNDSWTRITCDQCSMDVDAIVRVGQAPDYESHTAGLCKKCLLEAVDIFSKEFPE